MLKNYLCSLKPQTYIGLSESDGAKKPLNPFLGELFLAEFDNQGQGKENTKIIAEQVSHQPPVTAAYLWNEQAGIRTNAYIAQKTSFSPTSGVRMEQLGHAILHLDQYDEDYLVTLPVLNVKNIMSGSPYPELSGTCYVASSSGFTSKIEFEGKKLLGMSGKKNTLNVELYHNEQPSKPLYKVSGQWNDSFTIHDCQRKQDVESIKVDSLPMTPMLVRPVEEQDPWETRRAWKGVLDNAATGNVSVLAAEKNKVEEGQRLLRKLEQDNGQVFRRVFFEQVPDAAVAKRLLQHTNDSLHEIETDGVWRFKGVVHAQQVQKPYHRGILPTGPEQR